MLPKALRDQAQKALPKTIQPVFAVAQTRHFADRRKFKSATDMLRTQKQTYEQSPQLFQHVEKYLAENL